MSTSKGKGLYPMPLSSLNTFFSWKHLRVHVTEDDWMIVKMNDRCFPLESSVFRLCIIDLQFIHSHSASLVGDRQTFFRRNDFNFEQEIIHSKSSIESHPMSIIHLLSSSHPAHQCVRSSVQTSLDFVPFSSARVSWVPNYVVPCD
jgi:hypothetical protein